MYFSVAAIGLAFAPATLEPVDQPTEAAAEAQYGAFLSTQGIDPGMTIACAIVVTSGDPTAPLVGLCYANTEAPGVVAHLAVAADRSTFTFTTLEDDAAASGSSGAATTFGDGTWIVGTDVAPGRYRAPGGDGCYWARLADFSGEDIIANEFSPTNSQVLVEIAPTDVAFETSGCGEWEPVG